MNILEAIKSGRGWRRPCWYGKGWYKMIVDAENGYGTNDSIVAFPEGVVVKYNYKDGRPLDDDDILADDYILEGEEI